MEPVELLNRAKRYSPADETLRACWSLVMRGIEAAWLDEDELHKLVEHLRTSRSYGVEEISFEHIEGRLRVSFLEDRASCRPADLIAALSRLLD